MSEEKQEGNEEKKHKMFLVTMKTNFEIKPNGISIDRDLSGKEIIEVVEKEIETKELETLGKDVKSFNERQEFYAREEGNNKGSLKFQFIASKDPREQKPL